MQISVITVHEYQSLSLFLSSPPSLLALLPLPLLPSLSPCFAPSSSPSLPHFTFIGILVQLSYQYPRSISEPSIYDSTRVHHDSTPSMRRKGDLQPDLSVRHVICCHITYHLLGFEWWWKPLYLKFWSHLFGGTISLDLIPPSLMWYKKIKTLKCKNM